MILSEQCLKKKSKGKNFVSGKKFLWIRLEFWLSNKIDICILLIYTTCFEKFIYKTSESTFHDQIYPEERKPKFRPIPETTLTKSF